MPQRTRLLLLADDLALGAALATEFGAMGHEVRMHAMEEGIDPEPAGFDALVVIPDRDALRTTPKKMRRVLGENAGTRIVVISSAVVYQPDNHHPGMAIEDQCRLGRSGNALTRRWRRLEAAITEFSHRASVLILRPPAMPIRGGYDFFSRLFHGRWAAVLPGHDPGLQLMTPGELARAIVLAVSHRESGIFNLAAGEVVPLRRALRRASVLPVPVPRLLQVAMRRLLGRFSGRVRTADHLDFIRYSWTVSGASARAAFGFEPAGCDGAKSGDADTLPRRDEFGLDRRYIEKWSRTLLPFLHRVYWRVELEGIENVPRDGPVVLVGVHRGWVPMDAVLVVYDVLRHRGRVPRFLVHPGLLKFPFFFDFITRFGGLVACRENAEHILRTGGALGMFPEGVRGPFRLYRDAYRLGRFGNDEFLRAALRHRARIVPFVTVGSAEAFPIVGRLDWRWFKRWSEWPFLPVAPTLLPLPLPSRWHTRFLPPLTEAETLDPNAADDPAVVRRLRETLRETLAGEMEAIRRRRPSPWHGRVFERAGPSDREHS